MVLAAGFGVRMQPLTLTRPKPLVRVAGRALLDHVLDRLATTGVERAVVNVHYLADQIVTHVAHRERPHIVISDERDAILGTGGGLVRALPHFEGEPFFLINSDTIWIDGPRDNLDQLACAFDPMLMDAVLLLAPSTASIGYEGRGDFLMGPDSTLRARRERDVAPFVYAGAAILHPRLFVEAPKGEFALTQLFSRAQDAGRLCGVRLDGTWMHVGTPDAVELAEAALGASAA